MNPQPQLCSISAKAPQRWLPISKSDDEVRIEQHEKHGKETRKYCTTCLKDRPGLVLLGCGHRYCNGCLDHHIRLMLRLEDLPPRCCKQAISVYKYSDVLSHAVLSRYLQARTRKAHQGAIRCAGSECTDKRSTIRQYLIEDEWGLCEKCHQVTCARCCRLRTHHKGDREARVCPTATKLPDTNPATVDVTTEDALSKEVPKKIELQECSKCNQLISPIVGYNTMPCPCGAIICLKCAGAHRKTQALTPFGCWCRAIAQPQLQPRSAISEKASDMPHPPTSAPDTSAAPRYVRTGVDSSHENKLPPMGALLQQQQQRVHQGQIQELFNPHHWVQETKPGQCNQCRCSEQVIAQCSECGQKSCWTCSRSSCGGCPTVLQISRNGNRDLINSASFPTPDSVRHALHGKENGLTRNQISQALSCPVGFLNKILGQMLNANLIWVFNTDDETRYGLRQTLQNCANNASASIMVCYDILHRSSHSQLNVQLPQSDQTCTGSHRASTALDILAEVCHDYLEEGGLLKA